ncbi:MAG: phosphatase PAP2 family protein [Pirellulales bacterium]
MHHETMALERTPTVTAANHFSGWTRLLVAGGLTVAGLLALAIDLPVAEWFHGHRLPKELNRYLNFAEVFGHGIGVAMIMLGAFVLDGSLRFPSLTWPAIRWPTYQPTAQKRHAARMLGGLLAGPLLVLLLKQLVDRVRPRAADFSEAADVFATFGRGLLAAGAGGGSDLDSFPSGHSATAAALASILIWKYPRGRWFFVLVAASACLQRLASSAHYPSDACLGAAIGVLGAAMVLGCEESPAEQAACAPRSPAAGG